MLQPRRLRDALSSEFDAPLAGRIVGASDGPPLDGFEQRKGPPVKTLLALALGAGSALGARELIQRDPTADSTPAPVSASCDAQVTCNADGTCTIVCTRPDGETCTIELACDGDSCRVVSCDGPEDCSAAPCAAE